MAEAQGEKLYTLTQVAKETKISMPTLQRYKKLYQDRIPSVGKGRSQRYPQEALAIFRELKKENIGRRGRPRKNASVDAAAPKAARKTKAPAKRGRKPKSAAAQSTAGDGLLTLTQIAKLTKISYPTLQRYVAKHSDEIPHEGDGRKRRYPPTAVDVFKRVRSESKRGRTAGSGKAASKPATKTARKTAKRGRPAAAAAAPSDAALANRIKDLEKSHKDLEKIVARLEKQIAKPFKVTLQRK